MPEHESIVELFYSLRKRWGSEWVVDRLIDLAGHAECSWLEFKATMTPPEKRECYSDGARANLPKYVSGDYSLHVVKALVALANGGCGGIVLLGIAEDENKRPVSADMRTLKNMPQNADPESGRADWNTDRWEQDVHLELKRNLFRDRYQTEWRCSVDLDSRIHIEKGIFHHHPVLILIVPPGSTPIWLVRKTWIGVPLDKEKKLPKCQWLKGGHHVGCHYPHDPPVEEEVFHIMKRTGASDNEWNDPLELLDRWKSRYKFLGLDMQDDEALFQRFNSKGISCLSGYCALRTWSFAAVIKFLRQNGREIDYFGSIPDGDYLNSCCFFGGSADDRGIAAGLLCRNLLYYHELQKPVPLFLMRFTPRWIEMLKESTASFFERQLTDWGGGSFSVENIRFFGRLGKLQFVLVAPEFTCSAVEDLWFQAVRKLEESYFQAAILLFCNTPPANYNKRRIPVEELKNRLKN